MRERLTNSELSDLLGAWDLDWEKIRPVKDVYKIYCRHGIYCLKCSEKKRAKTGFMLDMMSQVRRNGFNLCPEFFPARNGKLYVMKGDDSFYLTNWLEGRMPDFKGNDRDIAAAGETLARFHLAARYIENRINDAGRVRYGKFPKQLQKSLFEMEQWAKRAEGMGGRFARIYLENYPRVRDLTLDSQRILQQAGYRHLSNQAMNMGTVAHGDAAARNFLIARGQPAKLIDFDSCRYDLQLTDVYKLMRRVLKKNRWQLRYARVLLKAYSGIVPISPDELKVLLAYLLYPKRFYIVSSRYFTGNPEYSKDRLLGSLKESCRQLKGIEYIKRIFGEEFKISLE